MEMREENIPVSLFDEEETEAIYCTSCGKKIKSTSNFCIHCGAIVMEQSMQKQNYQKKELKYISKEEDSQNHQWDNNQQIGKGLKQTMPVHENEAEKTVAEEVDVTEEILVEETAVNEEIVATEVVENDEKMEEITEGTTETEEKREDMEITENIVEVQEETWEGDWRPPKFENL